MPRISLPVEQMKNRYQVVVIGSGYGGAIAASRMARAGRPVCVLACGLGCTSLINANVGLRAEKRVFDDPAWPAGFREDSQLVEESYARAEKVLNPQPVPDSFARLPTMEALHTSAESMKAQWY